MKDFWKGAIPRFIPNFVVVFGMNLLKGFGVSGKYILRNREENEQVFGEHQNFFKANQFIENQAQWSGVKFGKKCTMAYSGCEILAAYNALVALGEKPDENRLLEMIGWFEKKGSVLSGMFGSTPNGIAKFFKEHGYKVTKVCGKAEEKLDALLSDCQTVIVTVYNDAADITKMVHTICITKDLAGKYILHNAYKKDASGQYCASVGFDTAKEAVGGISRGNAKLLYAVGVSKECI